MAREPWLASLELGEHEAAWDEFIHRYHRLIFSTVSHYAEGYDEVMDLFAHACDALSADNMAAPLTADRLVQRPDPARGRRILQADCGRAP